MLFIAGISKCPHPHHRHVDPIDFFKVRIVDEHRFFNLCKWFTFTVPTNRIEVIVVIVGKQSADDRNLDREFNDVLSI